MTLRFKRVMLTLEVTAVTTFAIGTVATPVNAIDTGDEAISLISPDVESQRIIEDLAAAHQDPARPEIVSYNARVIETESIGSRSARFPIPAECSISDDQTGLTCPSGDVILAPAVLTLAGEEVPFTTELSSEELVVTTGSDGEVFGLFAGDESDSDLVNAVPENFASMLREDAQEAQSNAPDGTAEAGESDDEPTGEWEEDWTKTEASPEEIGEPWVPSATDTEPEPTGPTPIFGEVIAHGSYQRPTTMINVPSNYVYCASWTASRCKPKNLHDFCSYSPDGFRYKTKLAWGEMSFRGPCARHDLAIDGIRKKSISLASKRSQRATADNTFKSHLRQNCGYVLYRSTPVRTSCFGVASAYYTVVKAKTADWNGQ